MGLGRASTRLSAEIRYQALKLITRFGASRRKGWRSSVRGEVVTQFGAREGGDAVRRKGRW